MSRFFSRIILWLAVTIPVCGQEEPSPAAAAEEAAPQVSLDDLYDTGRVLFELFAPAELKERFAFPTREQWDAFAARLQTALEGESLAELADYEPEARAALLALQAFEGGYEYADWLEERLDYIEASQQAAVTPLPPEPIAPVEVVPHLDLWRERLHARPVPTRAERLVPGLQAVFAAEGVPAELVWLAEVESTFNPVARSPAGARGLFQLMPATARELGLRTFFPDERTDPAKSAQAAARYLRQMHDRFGDWPLALAAYNAGPGRVRRTLEQHGAETFAGIAAHLPAETQMYVPKVLATIETRTGTPWETLVTPARVSGL
ncbi:MAG: lytic transglycosylase domain-containing protein [Opitutaceae bacterium]|nr:lytic transglycosylase domain-containing protein [Opitutaceae bacterium]